MQIIANTSSHLCTLVLSVKVKQHINLTSFLNILVFAWLVSINDFLIILL